MPLINCDAKALEWYCAVFLSQDKVGIKEIYANEDIHANNQRDFKLPTRLTAKTYLFRLIFGGSAYSYAHDPDFTDVSTSEKYWEKVIERTYNKYQGLDQWHTRLLKEVVDTGHIKMPTGRQYAFPPREALKHRTQILNYPVQGFGADLMTIARVSLRKRMKKIGLRSLLVCTVHDSILVDAPVEEVKAVARLMFEVFNDVPRNFERVFGVKFNLPLRCEVQVGDTWDDMVEIKKEWIHADQNLGSRSARTQARAEGQVQHVQA